MDGTALEAVKGWAIFVSVAVVLILLIKSLVCMAAGNIKRGVLYVVGCLIWVIFTVVSVFMVILSGMDHSSASSGASAVITISVIHTCVGGFVAYRTFRGIKGGSDK